MVSNIFNYLTKGNHPVILIILFFFLIRLIGITNAPLETGHNWRQSMTNMTARNFLEVDNDIMYPRIDHVRNGTGIIGSEFPIFNYLIYIYWKLFGFNHWIGRLINLITISIGTFCLYLLIKINFNRKLAVYTVITLTVSLVFSFSRKIMPDTFSMGLMFIGLYFYFSFVYEKTVYYKLILFFLFSSIAALSKIPNITILSVSALPLIDRKVSLKLKIILLSCIILTVIPALYWYFYWVPKLLKEGANQLYFPRPFITGIKELYSELPKTLMRFYFSALQSFISFAMFLFGLGYSVYKRNFQVLAVFGTGFFTFCLFMFKMGDVFSEHNYYIMSFIPFMAFISATGIYYIPRRKIQFVILGFIVIEGIANQHQDFRIKEKELYKLRSENVADSISNPGDKIAIMGDLNPQELYFVHRKGWILYRQEVNNEFFSEIAGKGCKYYFANRHYFKGNIPKLDFYKVYQDSNYIIYDLTRKEP